MGYDVVNIFESIGYTHFLHLYLNLVYTLKSSQCFLFSHFLVFDRMLLYFCLQEEGLREGFGVSAAVLTRYIKHHISQIL